MATTVPELAPAVCGLMPHAPVLVPSVAGREIAHCRRTSEACARFARRVVESRPDRLLLVSPHAPRSEAAFGLLTGARLAGSLSRFGAHDGAIDLPNDRAALAALEEAATDTGSTTWRVPRVSLDHGAVVPLWFLERAGWRGPTSVVAPPIDCSAGACKRFGAAVGRAFARLGGRVALIASGDMTHRAAPGAPAGYDPRGVEFDRRMTELIDAGRVDEIAGIDASLRSAAAEDAVDPSTVVLAALDFRSNGAEVLSYESPFGVGYLVAVFHDGRAS